ncbi:hypothetical protein [Ligilactobacillus equi]|uniref:Uncharacterized protein n=1 Tax=Ligilactobacillus equi DSM 15833 = JCM 10991 TaxID=1423740 RepID=A0A0R1TZH7_9LACO|nr:hypothetical protein [Ligilactobacillus equi]KRL84307.1 hypothetical protein FC36_GL000230 [Ligilactobacillus equi DSM 15833 = JCM 10991]
MYYLATSLDNTLFHTADKFTGKKVPIMFDRETQYTDAKPIGYITSKLLYLSCQPKDKLVNPESNARYEDYDWFEWVIPVTYHTREEIIHHVNQSFNYAIVENGAMILQEGHYPSIRPNEDWDKHIDKLIDKHKSQYNKMNYALKLVQSMADDADSNFENQAHFYGEKQASAELVLASDNPAKAEILDYLKSNLPEWKIYQITDSRYFIIPDWIGKAKALAYLKEHVLGKDSKLITAGSMELDKEFVSLGDITFGDGFGEHDLYQNGISNSTKLLMDELKTHVTFRIKLFIYHRFNNGWGAQYETDPVELKDIPLEELKSLTKEKYDKAPVFQTDDPVEAIQRKNEIENYNSLHSSIDNVFRVPRESTYIMFAIKSVEKN